jgi:hypothetical protein
VKRTHFLPVRASGRSLTGSHIMFRLQVGALHQQRRDNLLVALLSGDEERRPSLLPHKRAPPFVPPSSIPPSTPATPRASRSRPATASLVSRASY